MSLTAIFKCIFDQKSMLIINIISIWTPENHLYLNKIWIVSEYIFEHMKIVANDTQNCDYVQYIVNELLHAIFIYHPL